MSNSLDQGTPLSPSSHRSGISATDVDLSELDDAQGLMTPEKNLQRIMWTGTIWFAAAVMGTAVFLGVLLASGWRPAVMPEDIQVVWWTGAALTALSLGLIGWSGCPILEVDVPTADKNKSKTMQFGTALFLVGSAVALFAVLLGPAS